MWRRKLSAEERLWITEYALGVKKTNFQLLYDTKEYNDWVELCYHVGYNAYFTMGNYFILFTTVSNQLEFHSVESLAWFLLAQDDEKRES